jgi:hypothetical protein
MHDEDGPRRLRQGADTPEPLLRALAALRKGVDDSARLERVGQKMEVMLNAQPAAASVGISGNKLGVLKLILLGGLGLLAPLWFFQHADDATVPAVDHGGSQPSAALVDQKQQTDQRDQTDQTPVAPAEVEPVAAVATVESEADQAALRRSAKALRPSRTRARKAREAVAEPRAEEPQPEPSAPSEPSADDARPAQAAQPSATEPTSPAPKTAAVAPREAPKEQPPGPSEADLLLQARRALKRDAGQALKLVSDHEARFANGRLVPEREVLAIEALRTLGRKAEAEERLHKFEARFPKSIHLQRLHEAR